MSTDVTIIIPTFRRVDMLERAVRSAFEQDYAESYGVLVVDNDPAASARELATTLEKQAPENVAFQYVHEPDAGVANARNTALDATSSPYIAFLDDDQSAPVQWLRNIMDAEKLSPAAITFGPVHASLPDHVVNHKSYLFDFFSRILDAKTGYIAESFGCGNSLMNMQLIPDDRPVFDTTMNETGGEDDLLYSRVHRSGGKFGWCAEAPVFEHVPEDRANLHYALVRAISYGQGPITEARYRKPPRWDLVLFWMMVGVYKTIVNSIIYAAKWIIRAEDRATYLDRTARGLGKLLWWKKFKFYGQYKLTSSKPPPTD